jgi:group I intron endonuclease
VHKVYIITNLKNNKVYIGKTSRSLPRRMFEHKSKAKREANSLLCRAINKYGVDLFTIELLAAFETENEAFVYEIEQIKIKKSNLPDFGYNITAGGEGQLNPNLETRIKIGSGKRGKKNSQETRAKISESMKGKTPWNKGSHKKTNNSLQEYFKTNSPWNKGIKKRSEITCKCGVSFYPPKKTSMFCSKSCAMKGNKRSSIYLLENNHVTPAEINQRLTQK